MLRFSAVEPHCRGRGRHGAAATVSGADQADVPTPLTDLTRKYQTWRAMVGLTNDVAFAEAVPEPATAVNALVVLHCTS